MSAAWYIPRKRWGLLRHWQALARDRWRRWRANARSSSVGWTLSPGARAPQLCKLRRAYHRKAAPVSLRSGPGMGYSAGSFEWWGVAAAVWRGGLGAWGLVALPWAVGKERMSEGRTLGNEYLGGGRLTVVRTHMHLYHRKKGPGWRARGGACAAWPISRSSGPRPGSSSKPCFHSFPVVHT